MVLPGSRPYMNTPMLPVAESVNLEPVDFDIELLQSCLGHRSRPSIESRTNQFE